MNRSSGDPIADRRYAYALAAAKDGDWPTASQMFEQALELAAGWAPGWLALGEARERGGDASGAIEAYRAALALDPDDALGAGPRLAFLEGASPQALPAAYVRTLFDEYAPHFARHLVDSLGYLGPALISEAIATAASDRRFAHALDLGCGDGLMGRTLRPRVDRLTGVDLSAAMIERARAQSLYDVLALSELCTFLEAAPSGFADLVVAADVLPYFGDLERLFSGVGRALARQGLFACTAEAADGERFQLGAGLRFAHSRKRLVDEAEAAGFVVRSLTKRAARRENGRDVPGWVAVFARNG
jgi:predicted TPR repeat methyltransferase